MLNYQPRKKIVKNNKNPRVKVVRTPVQMHYNTVQTGTARVDFTARDVQIRLARFVYRIYIYIYVKYK